MPPNLLQLVAYIIGARLDYGNSLLYVRRPSRSATSTVFSVFRQIRTRSLMYYQELHRSSATDRASVAVVLAADSSISSSASTRHARIHSGTPICLVSEMHRHQSPTALRSILSCSSRANGLPLGIFGRPLIKWFDSCYLTVVCLSVCDVRALWPNSWMDQDET